LQFTQKVGGGLRARIVYRVDALVEAALAHPATRVLQIRERVQDLARAARGACRVNVRILQDANGGKKRTLPKKY